MSYMLQFPSKPKPADLLSPPNVVFGICGVNVFTKLPRSIPYNMVVHFAPKLKDWVQPQPQNLPRDTAHRALRHPYVGINIKEDIAVEGLDWIICTMLRQSGVSGTAGSFGIKLSFVTAIKILHAWSILKLPVAGTDALRTHVLMAMVTGPAISAYGLSLIWATFDPSNVVVLQAAENFIRHQIAGHYQESESKEIIKYICSNKERRKFFLSLESKFPDCASATEAMEKTRDPLRQASMTDPGTSSGLNPEPQSIHEEYGTRKITSFDDKAKERKESTHPSISDESLTNGNSPYPLIQGKRKSYNPATPPPKVSMSKSELHRGSPRPNDKNIMHRLLRQFGTEEGQDESKSQVFPPEPRSQTPVGLGVALDGKFTADDKVPSPQDRKSRSERRRKERRASSASKRAKPEQEEETSFEGIERELESW